MAAADVHGARRNKNDRKVHEERWKIAAQAAANHAAGSSGLGRVLRELTLETPIRYAVKDPIEKWLNALLCLDSKVNTC